MNKSFCCIVLLAAILSSCGGKKAKPDPLYSDYYYDDYSTNVVEVPFKKLSGVRTIQVKINDCAEFPMIFDTGCSGMLISLQEAMSLVKSGTLSQNDILGEQQSAIASGDIIENTVFKLKEVSLTDTDGKSHTLYDVPVTVIEYPGASVLVGNIVIDQLAEYSYTIDLKKDVIVFQ